MQIDLGTGLDEGKVRRPQTRLEVAAEHRLELSQRIGCGEVVHLAGISRAPVPDP